MDALEKINTTPTVVDQKVREELTKLLYGSPAVPLINGVVIIVAAAVLWRVFPRWIAISWLITSLSVVLFRLALWAQYSKPGSDLISPDRWARRFTQATAVIGCLWGFLGATPAVCSDPIDYFFVAFVVAGLCAGAATRISSHPPAFYAFIGTAAPPMIVFLFLHGQLISTAMGGMVLTFIIVMILVGKENHQSLVASIRSRIEQETLNANLQEASLSLIGQHAVLKERSELLDNAQDAIFVLDVSLTILYWNKGAERLFGWSKEEVIGCEIASVFPDVAQTVRQAFEQVITHGVWNGEMMKRDKFGRQRTVASRSTLVRNPDGQPGSIFVINTDVTEQKMSRARIHRLAYFDPVTGLPNRIQLRERLQTALETAGANGQISALLFLDLDDFKTLNDTAGHHVGDLLLRQIAGRLRSSVRTLDCVARLGGDEFVILLEHLGTDAAVATVRSQAIGTQILRALSELYQLGNYDYQGTASMGITLAGDKPAEVDDLLKQADLAMYRSKAQGRNMACVFDPAMERELNERTTLLADLRHAIRNRELELHYQPQLDCQGTMVGCEALVRWRHPQRGLIPPGDFIPAAESSGIIIELGCWVLNEACRRLAAWQSHEELRDVSLAVNVSSRQFLDPNFVRVVEDALRNTAVNPVRLKLEITESVAMEKVNEAIAKMVTLKALGLQLSLDDFGTGYSSLSQLKLFPLEQLKIDRGFVKDVLVSSLDASIVRTIIDLGRNLNLEVIAEGVETAEQLSFLKDCGCRMFQGYFFSVPLTADALEQLAAIERKGSQQPATWNCVPSKNSAKLDPNLAWPLSDVCA